MKETNEKEIAGIVSTYLFNVIVFVLSYHSCGY